MMVNNLKASSLVVDLNEAFSMLRQNGMSLNPAKCTFGLTPKKYKP